MSKVEKFEIEKFEIEKLLAKKNEVSPVWHYLCGKKKLPVRFWIGVMLFLTTYINYTIRVNMSVSIVAMVQPTAGKETPECVLMAQNESMLLQSPVDRFNSTFDDVISAALSSNVEDTGPRYNWNAYIQGILLGSYFWGYTISSLPAGAVAEWLGPVNVIFWVHIASAVLNSATAFVASIHWTLVLGCRVLLGFGAGFVYPALQCLIARWAPPEEKGKFVSALMGNTLGTCVTWPLIGAVTQASNWEWGFHVISIQNIAFCIVFWFVCADSPEQHKNISEEERMYIQKAQDGTVSKKTVVPPYFKIFTSFSFWMLAILHFGNLWGMYLQLTGVPKFMAEVIGFNLKSSGGLSALPHLARLFLGLAFGVVGDAIKRKGCSDKFIRKFFVLFSHIIPGLLLIGISFVGCNWVPIVILLTLSMSANGAAVLTNLRNAQDLAPNFAGTIFGIISFTGGSSGFITPAVTSALTASNNGVNEWAWNFVIGGCVYCITGLIFILFGSVNQQSWNEKEEDPDLEKKQYSNGNKYSNGTDQK